jgi:hypothetical protein
MSDKSDRDWKDADDTMRKAREAYVFVLNQENRFFDQLSSLGSYISSVRVLLCFAGPLNGTRLPLSLRLPVLMFSFECTMQMNSFLHVISSQVLEAWCTGSDGGGRGVQRRLRRTQRTEEVPFLLPRQIIRVFFF